MGLFGKFKILRRMFFWVTSLAFAYIGFFGVPSFNTKIDGEQSPFSKAYVQCIATKNELFFGEEYRDSCGPIGWASYHFVDESQVYINWREFNEYYEDGSKVTIKYFENISFESSTRTFKGDLFFEKSIPNFDNPKRWNYEMTFNEDYSMVNQGKVEFIDQQGEEIDYYNYRDETRGERKNDWWYAAARN